MDQDQTAPTEAVWSGSPLFVKVDLIPFHQKTFVVIGVLRVNKNDTEATLK